MIGRSRTYRGEVWTDARGQAMVALPASVDPLRGRLRYELTPAAPGVAARVVSAFEDGRITIETDEPNVKVGWRVKARPRRAKDN